MDIMNSLYFCHHSYLAKNNKAELKWEEHIRKQAPGQHLIMLPERKTKAIPTLSHRLAFSITSSQDDGLWKDAEHSQGENEKKTQSFDNSSLTKRQHLKSDTEKHRFFFFFS